MTTTRQRSITCPNCSNQFEVDVVMSHTTGGRDTDFRPIPLGMSIIDLVIYTCARCGLTGFMDQFEGEVAPEVSKLVAERITPLVRDERTQSWQRYEYAAWIADWREEGDYTVADYYLRASWCCREQGGAESEDVERYYRAKAAEHFGRALETDGIGDDKVDVITYLIGELHRRNGEFDDATPWLRRAIELADGVEGRQWVADMARKQAELAGRNVRGDAEGE